MGEEATKFHLILTYFNSPNNLCSFISSPKDPNPKIIKLIKSHMQFDFSQAYFQYESKDENDLAGYIQSSNYHHKISLSGGSGKENMLIFTAIIPFPVDSEHLLPLFKEMDQRFTSDSELLSILKVNKRDGKMVECDGNPLYDFMDEYFLSNENGTMGYAG